MCNSFPFAIDFISTIRCEIKFIMKLSDRSRIHKINSLPQDLIAVFYRSSGSGPCQIWKASVFQTISATEGAPELRKNMACWVL